MNEKMLIKEKQGIMHKIINFFRSVFFKKKQKNMENYEDSKKPTQEVNESNISSIQKESESYTSSNDKLDKKEFLELYEKAKNNEIDLLSLDAETLRKLCKLLEQEIKIVEKATLDKKQRIKQIQAKLNNM